MLNEEKPMQDKPTPEQLIEMDADFRASMHRKASTDPKAKEWVEQDNQALTAEADAGRMAHDRDSRGMNLMEAEKALQSSRDARDDFRSDNARPGVFHPKHQRAWNEAYEGHNQNVRSMNAGFLDAARKSTPQEIEQLQKKIEERQAEQAQAIEQRQDIAKLPSEQHQTHVKQSLKERIDTVQQDYTPSQEGGFAARLNSRRESELAEGAAQEGASQGSARRRVDYAAYAASGAEDAAYAKQLEKDQQEVQFKLGRRGTNEEMLAHQEQRRATEQGQ
jgi:hypothetical protein